MKFEVSQIQIEKISKGIGGAVAVSALLENDLGVQKDISSANAVCVIKELISGVGDIIQTVIEKNDGMEDGNV